MLNISSECKSIHIMSRNEIGISSQHRSMHPNTEKKTFESISFDCGYSIKDYHNEGNTLLRWIMEMKSSIFQELLLTIVNSNIKS